MEVENNGIVVRKIKFNELDYVMDINETTLPENYPKFFYEKIFEKFSESFYIAHPEGDEENHVAYIMWRIERGASSFNMKYVKKAHLVSIAVLQNYRKLRIASRLMTETMNVIEKEYKVDEYILEVRVSNYSAVWMYERFGFERVKIIDKYYRDHEDAYLMAKNTKKGHVVGSNAMSVEDLKKFYDLRQMNGMIFTCPKCKYSYVKNYQWIEPNFVDKCYDDVLTCVKCKVEMKMKDIANAKYDVK